MSVMLGPYEIERNVGSGGMAEVVLAHYRGPSGFAKRVALKRILPAYSADADFAALFRDEARLAAHLVHPNVVSLHDFGELEGRLFMAMEFVDGVDLKTILQHLKKTKLELFDEELVAMLAIDLASGLAFAHDLQVEGKPANVVHRDVSPANVLVSADGGVKLADFGIARAMTSDRHRTRTGIVKGKVPYMSPEQALGQRVDRRADLFSLGVVLYECLALERPYQGTNDLDTLQRAIKGTHRHIAELVPTIHPAFADIIERLLRPRAEDRFQNAIELLDALGEVTPKTSVRRTLAQLVRTARGDAPAPNTDTDSTRGIKPRALPEPDADRTRIDVSPSWLSALQPEAPAPANAPAPAQPARVAPMAPLAPVAMPPILHPAPMASPPIATIPAPVATPVAAPIAPPVAAPIATPIIAPAPAPIALPPVVMNAPSAPAPLAASLPATPMLAPPASLAPLAFAQPSAAPLNAARTQPRARRNVDMPRTPAQASAAPVDDSDAVARWTFRGLAVLALLVMLLSLGIVLRAALDTERSDAREDSPNDSSEAFDEEENEP